MRLNSLFLSIPEYKYIHVWHMVELKHAISYVNARRVLNIKSLTAASTVSFYSSFLFQLISQMAILMCLRDRHGVASPSLLKSINPQSLLAVYL